MFTYVYGPLPLITSTRTSLLMFSICVVVDQSVNGTPELTTHSHANKQTKKNPRKIPSVPLSTFLKLDVGIFCDQKTRELHLKGTVRQVWPRGTSRVTAFHRTFLRPLKYQHIHSYVAEKKK